MTPPAQVLQLIGRFERNLEHYKRSAYKETEVRVEFTATSTRGGIDPFFEALGWDVHNRQGRGEQRMLALHQKLATAAIPADKQLCQRQT